MQSSNSERQIFTQDFKSQEDAIEKMESFDYGVITKSYVVGDTLIISDEDSRDDKDDLHFESENKDGFYYYTIEKHSNHYRLYIYRTHKHKMITAAMSGNVEMFLEHFSNTDKMKEFALSTAIAHEHWDIIKILIDNHDLKKRPIWDAIRYNKVGILSKLIDSGQPMPKDWLAYCLYSDSIDVAKELLLKRKAHLAFSANELKTSWFFREIDKGTKTADFVKKFIK